MLAFIDSPIIVGILILFVLLVAVGAAMVFLLLKVTRRQG
jgi:hypothetical protein